MNLKELKEKIEDEIVASPNGIGDTEIALLVNSSFAAVDEALGELVSEGKIRKRKLWSRDYYFPK